MFILGYNMKRPEQFFGIDGNTVREYRRAEEASNRVLS